MLGRERPVVFLILSVSTFYFIGRDGEGEREREADAGEGPITGCSGMKLLPVSAPMGAP